MKHQKLIWDSKEIFETRLEQLKEIVRGLAFKKDSTKEVLNPWLSEIEDKKILEIAPHEIERENISAISLLTEAFDQTGDLENALKLSENFAKDFLKEIRELKTNKIPNNMREKLAFQSLIRQKIWLCFNFVHLLIRTDSLIDAESYLKICERIINDYLLDDEENSETPFFLYGTRSRLNYYLSLFYLQSGKLSKAKYHARESVIFASERYEAKYKEYLDTSDNNVKLNLEKSRARICFSKVEAFNFARIARANGYTKIALQKLRFAKLILEKTEGSLIYEMLDTEIAITLTYIAGSKNISLLEESNHILLKSLKKMKKYNFVYFIKETIYLAENLFAQAKHYKNYKNKEEFNKKIEEANKIADDLYTKLKGTVERQKNTKWRINLLHSQIWAEKIVDIEDESFSLDSYEEALSLVKRALDDTYEIKHNQGQAFSFYVKGKIYLIRYEYSTEKDKKIYVDKAIEAFKESRKKSNDNKLLKAYLTIYLAKCYHHEGRFSDFSKELGEYEEKYKNVIDHGFFIEESEKFESFLKNDYEGDDFLVESNIENLHFRELEIKLKKWLVKKATKRLKDEGKTVSEKAIATLLGYKSHNTIADLKK